MAKNKNETSTLMAQQGDLGTHLVELRERIGYTIPQIADAMCLSEETITRLENEEFKSLAEPPYIRGYLRNYAKLAEAEADNLIAIYESLRGADPSDFDYHFKTTPKIHSQQKQSISPVIIQLFFLALLLGILGAISMVPAVNQWIKVTWNNFSNQTTSQSEGITDNPLLTGTMPIPSPLPIETTATDKADNETLAANESDTELSTKTTPNENTATDKKTDDVEESNKVVENEKSNTESPTDSTDNKKTDEAKIPTPTNDRVSKVKLVFSKEVWMRIRDEKNKTVFEGQNPSGEEKILDLKKPLTFRVGNAQGLSLFIDDIEVDISGYIKGSVANFTLD